MKWSEQTSRIILAAGSLIPCPDIRSAWPVPVPFLTVVIALCIVAFYYGVR